MIKLVFTSIAPQIWDAWTRGSVFVLIDTSQMRPRMIEGRSSRPDSPRAPSAFFVQNGGGEFATGEIRICLRFPFWIGYRGGGRTLETMRSRPHTYVKLRRDGMPPGCDATATSVDHNFPRHRHHLYLAQTACRSRNRKKLSYFIILQSRLSTEQFEGARARRQPSG
jgi:hypothetical protein